MAYFSRRGSVIARISFRFQCKMVHPEAICGLDVSILAGTCAATWWIHLKSADFAIFFYCSLQVKLVVEQNEDFDLIIVNNNNTGDSSTRRSRSAAHMGQLRVCARTTATHSFHLVARQLGHINFTVQVTYLLNWQYSIITRVSTSLMVETICAYCELISTYVHGD